MSIWFGHLHSPGPRESKCPTTQKSRMFQKSHISVSTVSGSTISRSTVSGSDRWHIKAKNYCKYLRRRRDNRSICSRFRTAEKSSPFHRGVHAASLSLAISILCLAGRQKTARGRAYLPICRASVPPFSMIYLPMLANLAETVGFGCAMPSRCFSAAISSLLGDSHSIHGTFDDLQQGAHALLQDSRGSWVLRA